MVILMGENGCFGGLGISWHKMYVYTTGWYNMDNSWHSGQKVVQYVISTVCCTIDQWYSTHKGCKIYYILYYKCVCINVCTYFKSHNLPFNVTSFNIRNSTPYALHSYCSPSVL